MHSIFSFVAIFSPQESKTSLSEFAQSILKQICSQEWVIERCLQNADELCQTGMLIDPMLTSKQAHRLLQMICYTEGETSKLFEMKQKAIIQGIFKVSLVTFQ